MAADWPFTANAADFFEGRRPEERTLIDFCRTPFSFGLLLIPLVIVIGAFVVALQYRPTLLQALKNPQSVKVVDGSR